MAFPGLAQHVRPAAWPLRSALEPSALPAVDLLGPGRRRSVITSWLRADGVPAADRSDIAREPGCCAPPAGHPRHLGPRGPRPGRLDVPVRPHHRADRPRRPTRSRQLVHRLHPHSPLRNRLHVQRTSRAVHRALTGSESVLTYADGRVETPTLTTDTETRRKNVGRTLARPEIAFAAAVSGPCHQPRRRALPGPRRTVRVHCGSHRVPAGVRSMAVLTRVAARQAGGNAAVRRSPRRAGTWAGVT